MVFKFSTALYIVFAMKKENHTHLGKYLVSTCVSNVGDISGEQDRHTSKELTAEGRR